jgi:CRISPR type III-A-associated protein Csm2
MTDRITGTVKWFNASKGYGFISRSDGGKDVYVNISDVKKSGLGDLEEGQPIGFELERTPQGLRAVNLDTGWPSGYLEGGYFEQVGDVRRVKPAVVDDWAEALAQMLESGDMKAHQLRRFFNKARAIQSKLDGGDPFAAVVTDIHTFKRDAVYAVSREVAPEVFKGFIDRNVELAVQDEDSFRKGFIEHFQSILAFFTYHSRKK